ncbi:MAG: bifunctional nuclease family protein [Akkermansia muciniphila]
MPDEHLITLEPYALLYTRAGAGVCLRDPLTGKVGVIFMELTDGMALERCLNGERPVRPDTSSLLAHFLSAMECRVRLVLINGRKDEVFYARVTIEAANEVMDKLVELDARPSDALMMAVRFGTAIKIVPSVWESMGTFAPTGATGCGFPGQPRSGICGRFVKIAFSDFLFLHPLSFRRHGCCI